MMTEEILCDSNTVKSTFTWLNTFLVDEDKWSSDDIDDIDDCLTGEPGIGDKVINEDRFGYDPAHMKDADYAFLDTESDNLQKYCDDIPPFYIAMRDSFCEVKNYVSAFTLDTQLLTCVLLHCPSWSGHHPSSPQIT